MRLLLLIALLSGCARQEPEQRQPDRRPEHSDPAPEAQAHPEPQRPQPPRVPYPDAGAPAVMPALAASPDSNCGGVLDVEAESVDQRGNMTWREGAWGLGYEIGGSFDAYAIFNSEAAALDCRGSSDLEVKTWVQGGWR